MNPAWSVILLTTLTGAGQGLFLAVYAAELAARSGVIAVPPEGRFFALASVLIVALAGAGLLASFFHLGRPERAWRAAAMWRTSWLSREVIVLPAFIGCSAAYGIAHYLGWRGTVAVGAAGTAFCVALFVCTGMIYACLRFLQEWHTPWTVINFLLLGAASGLCLAAAFSAFAAPDRTTAYSVSAIVATLLASITRSITLRRNARLRHLSSVQTAIGIRHPRIVQKSQGFMGGSFNTREFFHRRSGAFLRSVKWGFLVLAFVVPTLLIAISKSLPQVLLPLAFVVQFAGLLAERWFFFAQANHPQNLYYQAIS